MHTPYTQWGILFYAGLVMFGWALVVSVLEARKRRRRRRSGFRNMKSNAQLARHRAEPRGHNATKSSE